MQAIQDFKRWYAENWRGSRIGSWPLFLIILFKFLIVLAGTIFLLVKIGRMLAGLVEVGK